MRMAVIGDGTVGTALAKAMGVVPFGPGKEPICTDVVVICVPTETIGGRQDLTQVRQAISRVEKARLIILRSTVLPGTTEKLQKEVNFPLMFVPEFGFEATMEADLAHPSYYILGITPESFARIDLAKDVLPEAAHYLEMKSISAEFAKYFCNLWGSSQVVLANSCYDWVVEQTGDPSIYEEAVQGATFHRNIPKWGWVINQDGQRGYGGKCLPKDTQAAISQHKHPLWVACEKYNNRLRGK